MEPRPLAVIHIQVRGSPPHLATSMNRDTMCQLSTVSGKNRGPFSTSGRLTLAPSLASSSVPLPIH